MTCTATHSPQWWTKPDSRSSTTPRKTGLVPVLGPTRSGEKNAVRLRFTPPTSLPGEVCQRPAILLILAFWALEKIGCKTHQTPLKNAKLLWFGPLQAENVQLTHFFWKFLKILKLCFSFSINILAYIILIWKQAKNVQKIWTSWIIPIKTWVMAFGTKEDTSCYISYFTVHLSLVKHSCQLRQWRAKTIL